MASETVVFHSTPANRYPFKEQKIVVWAMHSTKGFTEGESVICVSSSRKYAAYNLKSSSTLRILQRVSAKHTDYDALKHNIIAIKFLQYDSDCFVCQTAADQFHLFQVTEAADQSLHLTELKSFSIFRATSDEKAFSAFSFFSEGPPNQDDPLQCKRMLVLSTDRNLYKYNLSDGTSECLGDYSTTSKRRFLFTGNDARLLAAPATGSGVKLYSLENMKEVLSRPWHPHGEDYVENIVFLKRQDGPKGTVIITTAANNREVRVWCLEHGSIMLEQSIDIVENQGHRRLFGIDPTDTYLLFPSPDVPSLIVAELMPKAPAIRRISDFNTGDPLLCAVPVIRKVGVRGKVEEDLAIVARTGQKVQMMCLGTDQLEGPPNVGAAEISPGAGEDSVERWFGSDSKNRTSAAEISKPAAAAPAENPAYAEWNARRKEILDSLKKLEESVRTVQQLATNTMGALSSTGVRDNTMTKARNAASRLAMQREQTAPQLPDLDVAVDGLAEAFTAGTKDAAKRATLKYLQRVPDMVESAAATVKEPRIPRPKLGATESMRVFSTTIDRCHKVEHDLIKGAVGTATAHQAKIRSLQQRSASLIAQVGQYNRQCEIATEDATTSFNEMMKLLGGVSPNLLPPMTKEEKLAKALELSVEGKWNDAFFIVLQERDLAVLVEFLESKVVSENRQDAIAPKTISFEVFVALSHQLALELRQSLWLAPLRVDWLSDLAVNWHTELQNMKASDDPNEKTALKHCNDIFQSIIEGIKSINVRGEIDRASRKNVELAQKVFNSALI